MPESRLPNRFQQQQRESSPAEAIGPVKLIISVLQRRHRWRLASDIFTTPSGRLFARTRSGRGYHKFGYLFSHSLSAISSGTSPPAGGGSATHGARWRSIRLGGERNDDGHGVNRNRSTFIKLFTRQTSRRKMVEQRPGKQGRVHCAATALRAPAGLGAALTLHHLPGIGSPAPLQINTDRRTGVDKLEPLEPAGAEAGAGSRSENSRRKFPKRRTPILSCLAAQGALQDQRGRRHAP